MRRRVARMPPCPPSSGSGSRSFAATASTAETGWPAGPSKPSWTSRSSGAASEELLQPCLAPGESSPTSRPGVGAVAGAVGRVAAAPRMPTSSSRSISCSSSSREEAHSARRQSQPRGRLDRDPAPGAARRRRRSDAFGLGDRARGPPADAAGACDLHGLVAAGRRARLRRGPARGRADVELVGRPAAPHSSSGRRCCLSAPTPSFAAATSATSRARASWQRLRPRSSVPTVVACEVIKLAPMDAPTQTSSAGSFDLTPHGPDRPRGDRRGRLPHGRDPRPRRPNALLAGGLRPAAQAVAPPPESGRSKPRFPVGPRAARPR